MRISKLFILCVCVVALIAVAHGKVFATCPSVNTTSGHFDSDNDSIRDYDDDSDMNGDCIPDGNPVDNCRMAKNGDCDSDPLNCDVDNNLETSDLELRAGFQADWNRNGIGDACDGVDTGDSDGVADYMDNCKTVANADQDPRACTDTDGDRFEDSIDNCPAVYNYDQRDTDEDGFGEWCDTCPYVYNPDQDSAACPPGTPPTLPPVSGSGSPSQPSSSDAVAGSDYARGSGGCSITGAQSSSAWAIMTLLSALGIASARIRKIIL